MRRSTNRANARGNIYPADSHTNSINNYTYSSDGYGSANGNPNTNDANSHHNPFAGLTA
jgi:hypothetical protein